MTNKTLALACGLTASLMAAAQAPDGYYDGIEGYCEGELKTELYYIISDHDQLSYKELWTAFRNTDAREDGTVWDMYSDYVFHFGNDQCGNYSGPGDCYNREHSFPKSWFDDQYPMYTDLFHLYPTDGYINNQRGDRFSSFDSDMLAHNSYPCYADWALNMLLEWHHYDPVDQKEIDRNNAVYREQGNRNPYIDYPQLVDYIWGDKKDQPFSFTSGIDSHNLADIAISATDGRISIEAGRDFAYYIYALNGTVEAAGKGDGSCIVDLGRSGLYIIKVVTDRETVTQKVRL